MKILIGIQARSGSTRLPNKAMAFIDTMTMVDHVVKAAKESADHLNKRSNLTGIDCRVAVLVPFDDGLIKHYQGKVDLIQGPEDNVLSRYTIAMAAHTPDYLVRLTADCPLISPAIISKHIATSVNNELDYCSNTFTESRTYIDGMDCEVISKRCFNWLIERDLKASDEEHVTTYLKRKRNKDLKYGCVIGHVDLSYLKFSVDTKQELEVCRANKASVIKKIRAMKDAGISIFRF